MGNDNGVFHCKWEVGIVKSVLTTSNLKVFECMDTRFKRMFERKVCELNSHSSWSNSWGHKEREEDFGCTFPRWRSFFQVKALLALASYVSCLLCVFLCCFPCWKKQQRPAPKHNICWWHQQDHHYVMFWCWFWCWFMLFFPAGPLLCWCLISLNYYSECNCVHCLLISALIELYFCLAATWHSPRTDV